MARDTPAERMKAMEPFLETLKPLRAEVVKLLMWEIGKTKGDAEKEFDRTVAYVRDTVSAVKSSIGSIALPHRGGRHRADPPLAARRGALHGALQLPAERDVDDADPRADHGQHRRREAPALRPVLHLPMYGVRGGLPAGRRELRLG